MIIDQLIELRREVDLVAKRALVSLWLLVITDLSLLAFFIYQLIKL